MQWHASRIPGRKPVWQRWCRLDLYRSGLFDPLEDEDMVDRPVDAESIRYGTWRLLKVDYLVIGHVKDAPGGNGYDIIYQLFDVHTQEKLLSQITTVGFGDLRFGSHRVADAIYEKLTGVPGAFSTRIAYISATGLGKRPELPVIRGGRGWIQPASRCGFTGTLVVTQLVTRWPTSGLCII